METNQNQQSQNEQFSTEQELVIRLSNRIGLLTTDLEYFTIQIEQFKKEVARLTEENKRLKDSLSTSPKN